jgi:hypothetical protein
MAEDKNETHYFLDGNPEELERLQLGQDVIHARMGKLVFAPIDFAQPGLQVLDSATADGRLPVNDIPSSHFRSMQMHIKLSISYRCLARRASKHDPCLCTGYANVSRN